MADSKGPQNEWSICRVCSQNYPQMIPIFSKLEEVFIADIITECTAVQIAENDGLPAVICSECVDFLNNFIQFIKKARQSDRNLRKMIKSGVKLETIDIEVLCGTEDTDPVSIFIKEEEFKDEDEDNDLDYQDTQDTQDSDNDADYELPQETRRSIKKMKRAGRKPKLDLSYEIKPKDSEDYEELDSKEKQVFTTINIKDEIFCCSCFKFFDSLNDLKQHGAKEHGTTKRINNAKKHVCQYCFSRYMTDKSLDLHHAKTKSIKTIYECQICNARYTAGVKRRKHAHNHPTGMIPKLPTSPKDSTTKEPHEESPMKICCAQNCRREFETMELLMAHSSVVHKANKIQSKLFAEERAVECPICFKRYKDEASLITHQQRLYLPKKHVCSICGLAFTTKADCQRHEREHRDENDFQCQLCPKKFFCKERLKAHMLRHSRKAEFVCNICGQSFIQRHSLKAHALVHEGKLPFECEVCKKAFRVKANMMYHMRVHTGEKPYPCRYCDMAFADSSNRQRHETSHTGNYPYKCDVCNKGFTTKRLKKEHESTHGGQQSYQYSVCLVEFKKIWRPEEPPFAASPGF